ncbi:hypothetical protein ATCC90586_004314 [Pythium insidiosum]|nr:hypothetical protein ATCC90586_004314 [Pythium insidiosum]
MKKATAPTSESVQAAFGLFDDDSSDDEFRSDQHAIPEPVALNLVEQLKVSAPPAPVKAAVTSAASHRSDRVLYPAWRDATPEFVGPIEVDSNCANIGGSRGYIATEDLAPGTLVLVEKAFVPWPSDVDQSDPSFFIATVRNILREPTWKTTVEHLGHLHPQRLEDLPTELLTAGREKYDSQLAALLQEPGVASLGVSHEELLQNVFAMQCNAFDSGVFLHNAIFNHECNPNCIKFTPEDREHGVSEVRVARAVKKGEPLTISYLYPREQSRSRRLRNLREQFGFVCICELCRRGDSVLPLPVRHSEERSASDEEPTLVTIEEVEQVAAGAEELLKDGTSAAHVLSIALEALSDALEVVAHDHVVLMRIHKLVADCCDAILQARPSQDVREYAILFLRSSYELLELQRMYLNDDHIDLARTLNDVSQGIQLLLSLDPKALLQEFSEWKDFRQASKVENEYRQEYRRIKRLYE